MFRDFTVLVEQDYTANNICGYITELRLDVIGETEEEVLLCLKDLIAIELEKPTSLTTFSTKIVTLQVKVDSKIYNYTVLLEEDYASNNFCGYIPNVRLNVVGETEEEVLSSAKELIALEIEKSTALYSSKIVTLQVEMDSPTSNSPKVSASLPLTPKPISVSLLIMG